MLGSNGENVESFTFNFGMIRSGGNHSCTFLVNPEDWQSCQGLEAVFHTDSGVIRMSTKGGSGGEGVTSSSSSGCNSGIALLGLGIVGIVLFMKRK